MLSVSSRGCSPSHIALSGGDVLVLVPISNGGWLLSRSPSSVALLWVRNWSYYEVTDLAGDGVRGEVAKYCVLYGELDGCTGGLLG